ncbi:MAG TPA: hypothetical protein VL048_01670 [Xanthobacteraceae bacterium]|nr:hypothetical protein [Xanthobacteraceae bacterium]
MRRLVVIVAVLALNGLTACTSAAEKAAAKFAQKNPIRIQAVAIRVSA